MNEALRKLIINLNHAMKRSDVLEQFNKTLVVINNEVVPSLAEINKLIKTNNMKIQDIPEIVGFNNMSGIKAKDLKSMFDTINKTIALMEKESNGISGLITKELPELIAKDVITVKQATILNIISNYNNIALYTLDFILYIVSLLDVKINGGNNSMVSNKITEIRTNMIPYGKMILFFNGNKKLISNIEKLSNDRVLVEGKDKGTLNILGINKFSLPLVSFIGNPIYHVKMWLVDRQINRYEVLKEKKKLLELRIMDLKSREAGENNPKLKKSIEYYEDKLETTEYKMRKIEED